MMGVDLQSQSITVTFALFSRMLRHARDSQSFLTMTTGHSTLWANVKGMSVTQCIFRGSNTPLDHSWDPLTSRTQFIVVGCWFEGNVPSGNAFSVSACTKKTTATYTIAESQLCQATSCAPPSASARRSLTNPRSQSRPRSQTSVPQTTPEQSIHPVTKTPASTPKDSIPASQTPQASDAQSETVSATPHPSPDASPAATKSAGLSQSGALFNSAPVERSTRLVGTAYFGSVVFQPSELIGQSDGLPKSIPFEKALSLPFSASKQFIGLFSVFPSSFTVGPIAQSPLLPSSSYFIIQPTTDDTGKNTGKEKSLPTALIGGIAGLIGLLVILFVLYIILRRWKSPTGAANSEEMCETVPMEMDTDNLALTDEGFLSQYQQDDVWSHKETNSDLPDIFQEDDLQESP
jgi:hypothetical protein